MDIKTLGNMKIGKKEKILKPTKIVLPKNIIKARITRWFSSKFSVLIGIIDYQGNTKFHLSRINEGVIRIDGGCYRVNSDTVSKTNTKYNIIYFYEDNPHAITFKHEGDSTIDASNLNNFMDMQFVNMVLKVKKRTEITFVQYFIIAGAILFLIVIGLAMTGVVDIAGFFMPGG